MMKLDEAKFEPLILITCNAIKISGCCSFRQNRHTRKWVGLPSAGIWSETKWKRWTVFV